VSALFLMTIAFNTTQAQTYPNPATDRLYLSGMPKGTKAEYKLLDMSGRVLQRGSYSIAGIETGSLSPGLYILQTQKNGKTYSLKFTKQ
jgi:hypothetical protein